MAFVGYEVHNAIQQPSQIFVVDLANWKGTDFL